MKHCSSRKTCTLMFIHIIIGLGFHGKNKYRNAPYFWWENNTMGFSGSDFPKKTNPLMISWWNILVEVWLSFFWEAMLRKRLRNSLVGNLMKMRHLIPSMYVYIYILYVSYIILFDCPLKLNNHDCFFWLMNSIFIPSGNLQCSYGKSTTFKTS